jgi:AcrR family transcriptional regulator
MAPAPSEHRSAGRPALLNRDRIIEAASTADNLDTLTMRELAGRLGVSHTALYRWVKNRDELFDLISEVLVDRILADADAAGTKWRSWLARLAWDVHDEFLALPGYASHLARPHRHTAGPTQRLRDAIIDAFAASGCTREHADQSYQIFITSLIGWLAHQENSAKGRDDEPRFELFLDSLLRGLPVREPGRPRPDRRTT